MAKEHIHVILSLVRVSIGGERDNTKSYRELYLRKHGLFWGQAKGKITSENKMTGRF